VGSKVSAKAKKGQYKKSNEHLKAGGKEPVDEARKSECCTGAKDPKKL